MRDLHPVLPALWATGAVICLFTAAVHAQARDGWMFWCAVYAVPLLVGVAWWLFAQIADR